MCWRRRRWCSAGRATCASASRAALPPGVTAKDMILHAIGRYRHRRRHRLSRWNMPAARSAALPLEGAADALQSLDRAGRQDGHGGAGRHHLRLSRRPRLRARRAPPGTPRWPTGARCRATPDAHFDREHRIEAARSRRRSPGAPARSRWSPVDRRCRSAAAGAPPATAPRWTIWAWKPAGRSPGPRSTGSSSAPAPTAASRTCATPPRCSAAGAWRAARHRLGRAGLGER